MRRRLLALLGRLPRAVRFGVVGLGGVLTNSGCLVLLHGGLHLPLALASALAAEIAIVHNFLWNNRWTFQAGRPTFRRLMRFNLVSLAGLGVNVALVNGLVHWLAWHYLLANLVAIGLVAAVNFALSSVWTWADVR